MNETLHRIHNVDIDAVGLGDFGKRGKLGGPLLSSAVHLENARGYLKSPAGSQTRVQTRDLKHVKGIGTPLFGVNRCEPSKKV